VLLNMMKGKAYLGTYLKSGGCVFFLKALVRKEFKAFESAFEAFRLSDGRFLSAAMDGKKLDQKLDMAWNLYAQEKLRDAGFASKWERAYIELDEFELALGSMSVYHFGARYPQRRRSQPAFIIIMIMKLISVCQVSVLFSSCGAAFPGLVAPASPPLLWQQAGEGVRDRYLGRQ
jgi:hypothetical protein